MTHSQRFGLNLVLQRCLTSVVPLRQISRFYRWFMINLLELVLKFLHKQDFLAHYLAQRNSFGQTLKSGAKTVEPGDIKRYFEELMELPLTGEDFRKLYQQQQEEKGQSRQQVIDPPDPLLGR